MKYQVGFSACGGDSCVKRDGGTSLESGVPRTPFNVHVVCVNFFVRGHVDKSTFFLDRKITCNNHKSPCMI